MNPNQKPHSRDKKVESGKAGVNKGRHVNTGRVGGNMSRPSGNTNRPSGGTIHPLGTSGNHALQNPITPIGNQPNGGQGGMPMRASGGLSLKKILGIVVAILIAYFILKSCGGIDLGSGITDMGGSDIGSDIGGLIDWGNGSGNSSGNGSNYNGYTDYSGNLPLDYTVSPLARAKRVTPLGNGNDNVTVMGAGADSRTQCIRR